MADMSGLSCGGSAFHHCSVGGSGCEVVAVPSANKTGKINPVSRLHEQGLAMCSNIV